MVGEVDLERRDARQGALGCPDLGGEVGQGHQVVAEDRRLLGEPVTGQLHAVTGVAREPDDHPVELLDLLGHCPTFVVSGALTAVLGQVLETCPAGACAIPTIVRQDQLERASCLLEAVGTVTSTTLA